MIRYRITSPSFTADIDSDDERETSHDTTTTFKEDSGLLSYVRDSHRTFKELIADIGPGGFKLLESENNNTLTVVIAFDENERAEKLNVFVRSIEVQTSKKRILTVDLPVDVDMKTGTSSSFENIIYVSLKKMG